MACGEYLVGFLNCWPDAVSGIDPEQRILYVEHLAAAPNNIDTVYGENSFAAWGYRFWRVRSL